MYNATRKALSLVLVLAMLIGICIIPAAADTGSKNYVFVGDSMTFNYGQRHAYSREVSSIYPELVAEKFGYTISGEITLGGERATDVYSLISDYPGDDFTDKFYNITDAQKAEAVKAVSEADVVSMMLGFSNFSVHFSNNLKTLMADEVAYDTDLCQLFPEEEVLRVMPYAEKALAEYNKLVNSDAVQALKSYWNSNVTGAAKEKLIAALGEDKVSTVSTLLNAGPAFNEAFIYMMVSHFIDFDRTIARVRELNDDADIYIMALTNPITNMSLSFKVNGVGFDISLSGVGDIIFGIMNSYMESWSKYSDEYTFVKKGDSLETYSDKMGRDEALTEEVLYSCLNGNWRYSESNSAQVQYKALAKELAPAVTKALSVRSFDVVGILQEIVQNGLGGLDFGMDYLVNNKDSLTLDESGNLTCSPLMIAAVHLSLIQPLGCIYIHPDQAGHNSTAQRLISAIEANTAAAEQSAEISTAPAEAVKLQPSVSIVSSIASDTKAIIETCEKHTSDVVSSVKSVAEKLGTAVSKTLKSLFSRF